MNILGVGPAELFVIFVVLLVVAGPKRMIEWAYHAGRYASQMRAMFQETMDQFQKEMAASGIEIPKELTNLPMGRFDIVSEAAKVINSEMAETTAAMNTVINPASATPATPATPTAPTSTQPSAAPDTNNQPAKTDDEQSTRYDSWLPN